MLYVYLPTAELFAFSKFVVCTLPVCVCVLEINSVLDKYWRKPAEMFISRGIWVLSHNTTSPAFAFTFFRQNLPSLRTRKRAITNLPWHLGRSVTPLATQHTSAQEFSRGAFKWIFKANPPHALIWAAFSPGGPAKPVPGEAAGCQGSR